MFNRKLELNVPNIPSLYQLKPDDFGKALDMLSRSFKDDPLWGSISQTKKILFRITFSMFLKYAHKYGKVYSVTNEVSDVAIWLPSKYTKKTLFRLLACNALKEMILLIKEGRNVLKNLLELEKDQILYMKKSCIYLNSLGVEPSKQGLGLGSRHIKKMIEHLPSNIPIYAETESEENVMFYEKHGFVVLKTIEIPELNVKMWEMHFPGK